MNTVASLPERLIAMAESDMIPMEEAAALMEEAAAALTTPEQPGVVITTDASGRCVAVTRQDGEGRILSVIWEASEHGGGGEAVAIPRAEKWLSDRDMEASDDWCDGWNECAQYYGGKYTTPPTPSAPAPATTDRIEAMRDALGKAAKAVSGPEAPMPTVPELAARLRQEAAPAADPLATAGDDLAEQYRKGWEAGRADALGQPEARGVEEWERLSMLSLAEGLRKRGDDLSTDSASWLEKFATPNPVRAEQQECGAIGSQGCTYRPEGPNGEMQCSYCGAEQPEGKGAGTTLREALQYVGQRTDWGLCTLAERCELWMRESKDLLASAPAAPVGVEGFDKRFAEMLLGILNDVQDELGFTDEDKLCANGSAEIVAEIRRLKQVAALAQQPEAASGQGVEWQPIETAPKDGTLVFLRYRTARPFVGSYSAPDWLDHGNGLREPTHWLPIPAAPTQEGK